MQVEPVQELRRAYLQSLWHPGAPGGSSCAELKRLGPPGDGGKILCAPAKLLAQSSSECHVLSVGSNGDATFEESIHAIAPSCRIDTFDGTLDDAKRSRLPSFVSPR